MELYHLSDVLDSADRLFAILIEEPLLLLGPYFGISGYALRVTADTAREVHRILDESKKKRSSGDLNERYVANAFGDLQFAAMQLNPTVVFSRRGVWLRAHGSGTAGLGIDVACATATKPGLARSPAVGPTPTEATVSAPPAP
jgi:hypothetical protein